MLGFVLFLVAIVLYIPLTVINLFAVMYTYGWKISVINEYFYQTAIDIDRFGNHNFRTLLNLTLIKQNVCFSYKFGDERETISSVLGKNKKIDRLSVAGRILCKILSLFDKDHCKKSIRWFNTTVVLLLLFGLSSCKVTRRVDRYEHRSVSTLERSIDTSIKLKKTGSVYTYKIDEPVYIDNGAGVFVRDVRTVTVTQKEYTTDSVTNINDKQSEGTGELVVHDKIDKKTTSYTGLVIFIVLSTVVIFYLRRLFNSRGITTLLFRP
jgi:hypothetical protein